MAHVCLLAQGAALGYVVLPLWGVSLASFDTPSTDNQQPCLREFNHGLNESLCAQRIR